ncbi:MAG: hypothetical protein ACREHG_06925 [Candidatus Saccharimonadales bacterium]
MVCVDPPQTIDQARKDAATPQQQLDKNAAFADTFRAADEAARYTYLSHGRLSNDLLGIDRVPTSNASIGSETMNLFNTFLGMN